MKTTAADRSAILAIEANGRESATHICPPEHKHGATGTCYVAHKCRCNECREGRRRYEADRTRRHLYGRFEDRYVDAAPVRAHIQRLQAAGMGWKRIAEVSGVGNTAIAQLIYGRKGSNGDPRKGQTLKRVEKEKAAKILAVRPTPATLAKQAHVPALGTHRRVKALCRMGYSQQRIAAMIGMTRGNFGHMMRQDRIENATAQRIARAYREHWNVAPVAKSRYEQAWIDRTKADALARGWAASLDWDDIDLDPLTTTERREQIVALRAEGLSHQRIADRIGVHRRTVAHHLEEAA